MIKKFFWPDIQDMEDAKKALNMGVSVCFLVAIITTAIVLLQTSGTINLFPGLGYEAFMDVALFAVLGILIKFLHSRLAALAALILYAGEQAYTLSHGGRFNYMAILFTAYLISSVRGAFVYHTLKKFEEEPGTVAAAPPQIYPTGAASEETGKGKKRGFFLKLALGMFLIAGLIFAGVWFFAKGKLSSKDSQDFGMSKLIGKISPSGGNPLAQLRPSASTDPGEIVSNSGKVMTLSLKNGKKITGEVIYEDETYYTLKAGGGQEIVIKEDVERVS